MGAQRNFLANRSARVRVGRAYSHAFPVQGIILGPILFSLYIADLSTQLRSLPVKHAFYADDLTVTASGPDLQNRLQAAADCICTWATANGMGVNEKKTHYIAFAKHGTPPPIEVHVNGSILAMQPHPKVLGVVFDQHLNFRKHAQLLRARLQQRLAQLSAISGSAWGPTAQEDAKGSICVRDVQNKPCAQEAEALAFLFEGNSNRVVSEHSLNTSSSRSHCIFTIHVTSRSRVESESASLVSKLHCIDLAGSERLSKTASTGKIMKEAQYINKSLTFLEQVVMALGTTNRAHIPFRQSRLTNLLKDSLGGNSKTTMIANLWPEDRHMEETIGTLLFATRMMKVTTEAVVNFVVDPATQIRQLQKQISDLKAELQMQNQLMGKSHIAYEGEIGEDERFEMEKTVRAFVSGGLNEIPVRSLREVKEYFRVFKAFCDTRDAELRASTSARPIDTAHPVVEAPQQPPSKQGSAIPRKRSVDGIGAVEPTSGVSIGTAAAAKTLKDLIPATSPKKTATEPPQSPGRTATEETPTANKGAGGAEEPREQPDKNSAFADFKQTEGARVAALITETQLQLLEKRKKVTEISAKINEVKVEIDSAACQLEQRRLDRQARGEDETVDDEEFEIVRTAKIKKQAYRQLYDELTNVRSERDHLTKTLDHARAKLLTDFDAWYENTYGSAKAAKGVAQLKSLRAVRTTTIDEDDALDEGERFEIFELNRVMNEDPDSVAFYSAKKLSQNRQTARKFSPSTRK